jgi:tRNA1(Val) A37 N6-methylase TrmN6
MSLDQPDAFVKQQTLTRDAFLGGRINVSQPKAGFRAGLDSVLLGAAVGAGRKSVLDLGAGAGVASLVALSQGSEREALLVEREPEMLALALGNLKGNGFADRAGAVLLDVTAKGNVRETAGLKPDHFDAVIANPPFFAAGRGTASQDERRHGARHMLEADLPLWIKTAASCAAPGGEVIFIHHVSALPELLSAFDGRFGAIAILPIAPRPGHAASRVLVRGIKGSGAPLTLLAPMILHGEDGHAFASPVSQILRGEDRLHW